MTNDEWENLRQESKADHDCLLMGYSAYPCYGRTSKLGLRHFAHRRGAPDDLPPWKESAEHLLTKALIVAAAENLGWEARTEVPSEDRSWIADTLVEKDGRRIAFEVQWSRQSDDDYRFRTQRYADQGIECIWFARRQPTLISDYYYSIGSSADTVSSMPPIYPLTVNKEALSAHAGGLAVQDTVAAILENRTGAVRRVPAHHHKCWQCGQPMWVWGKLNYQDTQNRTSEVAKRVEVSLLGRGQDLSTRPIARTDQRRKRHKEFSPYRRYGRYLLPGRVISETTVPYRAFVCPRCDATQSDVGIDGWAGALADDLLVPPIEGSRTWRAIAQQNNGGWIYTLPDEHW